jgi:transposase
MEQGTLLVGEPEEVVEARRAAQRAEQVAQGQQATARVVSADRRQLELRPQDLESLIPPGHRARSVWAMVEGLELSAFYEPIKARGSEPGRSATDPKVLVALWLYATIDGIGSARRLATLCDEHDAYRWLRGGVPVNHHTLSDFRVAHESALDKLLTQVLAVMTQEGLVTLKRVAQDGTRVRASAGAGSFRRRQRLEEFMAAAHEQVEAVKQQVGEADQQQTARRRAAQQRVAHDRAERVSRALGELRRIEQQREAMKGGHKPKGEPRASTTDPEARKMKMGDGGFRPAYNAQLSTDTESRVIVGAAITEDGTDYAHCAPMIEQIAERTETTPEEVLVDGGYISKESVDKIDEKGVHLYGPLPERKGTIDPYEVKPEDSAAMRLLKQRMVTPEAREIYPLRAATAETVNADLKTWRTLQRFLVRGKHKVRCVLLWNVLAYNLLRWLALAPSG